MSNELTLFDYASLPINDAMELNAIKERIKIRLKRTAEDIIEIGKDLIIAKEKCGHGGFEKWIGFEFEMNIRTAQNFMNVAEKFSDKNEIISFLKPTALYMLSAPSMPESVRTEIIDRVENGESVNLAEIQRLKKESADLQASKQALQNDLMAKVQRLDEAEAKVRFQALTVDALEKQNDVFRRGDQQFIDSQVEKAKADLILENQQAIADEKRKAENALAELERLKKEQAKAISDGVRRELSTMQNEIEKKQYQIEMHNRDIEKLREVEMSLEREVGYLQTHKKSIERIKDNLSFLTVSFSDAFDTNVIPAEVVGDWDAIYFAISKLKKQMSVWRDEKSPLESNALIGELVDLETILENVEEAHA